MSRRLMSCLLVALVLVLMVIGGCTKPTNGTGTLDIKLTVPEQLLGVDGVGPMEIPAVSYFKFTITKGSAVYTKTETVTGGEVSVSFDKLSPGVWTILVNGYSASDVIICSGTSTATVEAGKTTTANVVISLTKGNLTVRVVFPEGVTPATGTVILIDPINGNLTEDLVMGTGQGEAVFTAIEAKTWPIRVILYDGVGAELLQGESQVFVSPGVDTLAIVTFTDGGIVITITWNLPPSKPTGVTAVEGTDSVIVSWTANPVEEGVVGYLVYRADRADMTPYLLTDVLVAGTEYTDTRPVVEGVTYYYYVQAFNADGLSSELSDAYQLQFDLAVFSIPNTATQIKMKLISSGTFMMGSPNDELDSYIEENPQHQVTISEPFYMGIYEVTQAQWEAVMGTNPSYFTGDTSRPVERVSWEDCQEFITELNTMGLGTFRLPTEAEWEYACRSGSTTRFPWGDDLEYSEFSNYAWFIDNSSSTTHPVGQKEANTWGLYDMHGNVGEWCTDWFADYSTGAQMDPTGPASGSYRVWRGGSWSFSPRGCRSAGRGCTSPLSTLNLLGFRLVREY